MKASITGEYASYTIDLVRKICGKVGPGISGSCREQERAAIIEEELRAHLGVENVATERFRVAPLAFVSTYCVCAILMGLAVLLNVSVHVLPGGLDYISSTAALTCSFLAPAVFVLEFVLGLHIIDPFFRKKESLNVIGTLRRPGAKRAKRLLILSGHHDSAPENTWLRLTGYGLFFLSGTFLISLVIVLIMCAFQLTGLATGHVTLFYTGTIGWILFIFPILPSLIFGITFVRAGKNDGNVPGEGDNLSACALVVAMSRFLVRNPSCIPEDTEIRFITFGSEEAGCRGSQSYVARHLGELKQAHVRMLNYETVVFPEITILTSDVNGTVKNADEIIESIATAAKRAKVPYRLKPAMLGVSNDSGPFSKAGLEAITLLPFKIPQQLVAFYHQRWDKPENLTTEPLFNVLKLTVEWINQ